MAFEFADPKIERMVALSPADRKWMDDVVRTVEETWDVVSLPRGLMWTRRSCIACTCPRLIWIELTLIA